MKRKYISNFSISRIRSWEIVLIVLFFIGVQNIQAQPKNKEEDIALREAARKGKVDTIPVFNRMMIGVNIFEPIACAFGQTFWSSGIELRADFKERFLPVVEFGIARANRTNSAGANYKSTKGFYASLGIDLRALGDPNVGCLYVGARLGFATTTYNIYNVKINNSFWGEDYVGDLTDQTAHATYLRLHIGIKARMYKSLYMGWALGYGFVLNVSKTDYSKPFHLPGFGLNTGSGVLTFSYCIYFKLPLRPSAKPKEKKEPVRVVVSQEKKALH